MNGYIVYWSQEQMKKLDRVFAAFLAAALSVSLLCGCNGGKDSSSDTQQAVTQSAQADSSNINIPGFEALDFKADTEKQSVPFHNPKNNACYFRLTLTLDGETLWQSDDIAPDEKVGEIKLSHALDKGDYAAKLKYDCFTLQDKTPLNGAEIDLAINVK